MTVLHTQSRIASVSLGLGIGFLLQLALVSLTFPANELLSGKPLLYIDNAFHVYQVNAAREFSRQGSTSGYDPFFGAGTISGIGPASSGKIPALLAAALPPEFSILVIYKWYVFLTAVVSPLLVGIAARVLRLSSAGVFAATFLAILVWWTSYLHWYYTAGMVSFVAGGFLTVLLVALVIRALEEDQGAGTPVAAGLAGAAAFLLHPLTAIGAAPSVAVYVGLARRTLAVQRVMAVLLSVATLSLLPNLFWLVPMMTSLGSVSEDLADQPYQKLVDGWAILQEGVGMFGRSSFGAKLNPALLLAAAWGIVQAGDRRVARGLWAFAGAGAFLSVFAHLGALMAGVRNLQPNRFAPIAYLMLVIPAAVGIELLVRRIVAAPADGRRLVPLGFLAAIAGSVAYATFELAREVSPGMHGRYGAAPPQLSEPGETTRVVQALLNDQTTQDGRILFETSLGRVHDGAHIAGFLAMTTHRQFIGGPYPFTSGPNSWDGRVFGKAIQDIPNPAMSDLLALYNVGWVIVHSPESKRYFDQLPAARKLAEHPPIAFYRIERPLSYFVEGTGRVVSADYSGIELADVQGKEVILKYRYFPGMKSDTGTLVEPVFLTGAKDPFIRLREPPAQLKIFWRRPGM